MDIAIEVKKISLENERFIFIPTGILKGTCDKANNVFIDEYGYKYSSIDGMNPYAEKYFCYAIELDDLKETYFDYKDDKKVLGRYLEDMKEYIYVGYYDEIDGRIKTLEIDFVDVESRIKDIEYDENIQNGDESIVSMDFTGNFIFNKKQLEELRDCKTLEEVKKYINDLFIVEDYIKNEVQPINSNSVASSLQEKNINNNSLQSSVEQKENNNYKLQKEESKRFNLAKLRKEVLSNIVGQDEAVFDLTRAIAINQTSKNPRNKSHILITGPSGTGKTEMVNIVSKELDLPMFKANAPDYTKAGYTGKDVPSMLLGLLEAANDDLKKAQSGILIIDEIDKAVSFKGDKGFGKAVLHALLKILDRDIIEVDVDKHQGEKVLFDTSNLTIIFMGSFDELYQDKQKEQKQYKKIVVGFNNKIEEKCESKSDQPKIRLDEDDLVRWMGPEFVGRIGTITSTNELTHKNVLKILKESKLSQLKIIKEDLKERGIELTCTKGYYDEIARIGYSKNIGVRKLNKTVKRSFDIAYDEILTNPKVKLLKLTKKTAQNNKEYYVEY